MDHVTLKIGVMATESSKFLFAITEINYILKCIHIKYILFLLSPPLK